MKKLRERPGCRPCARAAAASRSVTTLQAVVEVFAELRRRHHGRQVAVGRGDEAHVDLRIVRVPPSRSNSCSCSTRRILACVFGLMSPISSRNSVPPSACSKRPMRCLSAPVNAPFSWPNSSDSSRFSCSAAQLTLTKLREARVRVVVDRAGDQLLAGAGLAADEHRGVALGHLAHDAQHAAAARRSTPMMRSKS